MKEELKEFIQERNPNLIEVMKVEERELEYVVVCLCKGPDTRIPLYNTAGRIEQSCLVNKTAFNNWLSMKNAIMWL